MNPLINNWVYGEVSPKLGGRFDLAMYSQGCETLLNMMPMLQGGITRRPPLKHVATTVSSRIVPFTISTGQSYLIELSEKKIRIWKEEAGEMVLATFLPSSNDYMDTDYLATEIWDVQVAQYYDRMYFAHRNHQQAVLHHSLNAFGFQAFLVYCDSGKTFGQSANNFPGVVSMCQNRLWFASTNLNPYTTWVSRPPYDGSNNHNNFLTFDVVDVETEVIKDSADWPTTQNSEGDNIIDFSDTTKFVETITDTEDVISAKCAMELELASGRNDTIRWIGGMDHIFIGTEGNEWVVPYNVDPTNQSASMQSSYGSLNVQPETLHDGIFFLQRGNRLREITKSQSGPISNDVTYTADHILSAGVRQIVSMKNPDPMLFIVLKDGSLAVLTYDRQQGMQGWARWKTEGEFVSLSTREDTDGQRLYAVVKRGSQYFLEFFDFNESLVFEDRHGEAVSGSLSYDSMMVGNRFDLNTDSGTTIGRSKKTKEVWVRCLDSGRISTGVDEKYMQMTTKPVGSEDFRIPISGGARKELRIRIEAVESDPLTLLAMTYDVEVN